MLHTRRALLLIALLSSTWVVSPAVAAGPVIVVLGGGGGNGPTRSPKQTRVTRFLKTHPGVHESLLKATHLPGFLLRAVRSQLGDHKATVKTANVLPRRVVTSGVSPDRMITQFSLGHINGLYDLSLHFADNQTRAMVATIGDLFLPAPEQSSGFDNLHESFLVARTYHLHETYEKWSFVSDRLAQLANAEMLDPSQLPSFATQVVEKFSRLGIEDADFSAFVEALGR